MPRRENAAGAVFDSDSAAELRFHCKVVSLADAFRRMWNEGFIVPAGARRIWEVGGILPSVDKETRSGDSGPSTVRQPVTGGIGSPPRALCEIITLKN